MGNHNTGSQDDRNQNQNAKKGMSDHNRDKSQQEEQATRDQPERNKTQESSLQH